jgi:hypothetical protein
MPQQPGPFSEYLDQSVQPIPTPKPTGLEGAGANIAFLASQFINGARQAKAQRFAQQQLQEQKEEDAYNAAMQRIAASDISQEEKNHFLNQLTLPLIQRIAADKETTSKTTGHPLTDFVKNIAVNITGGEGPKKKQPLDMGLVGQALLHAGDPANSLTAKRQGLEQQAWSIVNDVVNKKKGQPITSGDLLGDNRVGAIMQAWAATGSKEPPSAFKSYFGEVAPQQQYKPEKTPKQIFEERVKATNIAKGRAEDALLEDQNEAEQILQGMGILPKPTANRNPFRWSTRMIDADQAIRLGFDKTKAGAPIKPGDGRVYSAIRDASTGNTIGVEESSVPGRVVSGLNTRYGKATVLLNPNNGEIINAYSGYVAPRIFDQNIGSLNGIPIHNYIKQEVGQKPASQEDIINDLKAAGHKVSTVIDNDGVSHAFLDQTEGQDNTKTPPSVDAPKPVPATGNQVAPVQTQRTSPPPVAATKPVTSGGQSRIDPNHPENFPEGFIPKGAKNLPPAIQAAKAGINSSLRLSEQLKSILKEIDPETGRPLYENNSISRAFTNRFNNFLYKDLKINPGHEAEALIQLSNLDRITGAANYVKQTSNSARIIGEIQEHLPSPNDTPSIMWDKLKWIDKNLPLMAKDMDDFASEMMIPGTKLRFNPVPISGNPSNPPSPPSGAPPAATATPKARGARPWDQLQLK